MALYLETCLEEKDLHRSLLPWSVLREHWDAYAEV